ncbi:MAG: CPBP family glutamic-type intramembrane protease, partial [Anaerolineaceae bacterium]
MLTFIRKQSLLFFIVLTLLISWLPWLSGGQGFFVFGPSIAGVITIALVSGKEGLRELIQRALKWKVGWKWWFVALFLPALLTLIALGINLMMGATLPPFSFIKTEWYWLPIFFLITIIGGPLGEEFGWRGFMLPHLQQKMTPWQASLLIGL